MKNPRPGHKYRHFKGGVYTVLFLAVDEVSLELTVVYMSSEGDIWTRSVRSWNNPTPDGQTRFVDITYSIGVTS